MGERLAGSQKVIGSSPLSSTYKALRSNKLRKAFLLDQRWGMLFLDPLPHFCPTYVRDRDNVIVTLASAFLSIRKTG